MIVINAVLTFTVEARWKFLCLARLIKKLKIITEN